MSLAFNDQPYAGSSSPEYAMQEKRNTSKPQGDERFNDILTSSNELLILLKELNQMTHAKMDVLLGAFPCDPVGDKEQEPTCWLDRVLSGHLQAIRITRDTLQRINQL